MHEGDGGSGRDAPARTGPRLEPADRWECVEMHLGQPSDPQAWQRQRELLAQGWQVLGVDFRPGVGVSVGPRKLWA
jgi:hypothetical protein